MSDWEKEIRRLAVFTPTQPHSSFASLTHGIISRWTYSLRVSPPFSSDLLHPLEQAITQVLLPALTSQPLANEGTRHLLPLPSCLGRMMGIVNPMALPSIHRRASQEIIKPLVTLILQQHGEVLQAQFDQHVIKHRLHNSQ